MPFMLFPHSFIHSYMHACHVLYLCRIITIITHQSLHHITQFIVLAGIVVVGGGGGGRTVATAALRRSALTADIAQRATSSAER